MTTNQDGPDEGQVSETTSLSESDVEKGFQQAEGIPPAQDAGQEDQSRIEAEISPDDTQAEDVDEAVDRAVGREQV